MPNIVNKQEIEILFKSFIANQCSEEEIRKLFDVLSKDENSIFFEKLMEDYVKVDEKKVQDALLRYQMSKSFEKTDRYLVNLIWRDRVKKPFISSKMFRYAVAASILLVCSISGIILFRDSVFKRDVQSAAVSSILQISGQKNILIDTTSGGLGELVRINNVVLKKVSGHKLKLEVADYSNLRGDSIGELHIAKGMDLQLELLDGTLVNINSASIFRFPLHDGQGSRQVELQGEAYFDVTKDSHRPFIVRTADQVIKVYGTQFNVKNYADQEKVMTTLYHGKVSIKKAKEQDKGQEFMLSPGQRAVLVKNNQELKREEIRGNTEDLAWTQGFFSYEDAPLKDILQDFTRWYNVEVDWAHVPDLKFQGTIPRHLSLDKAILWLSRTGNIKINLTNNKITF